MFSNITLKISENDQIIKKQLEIVKRLFVENGGKFVEDENKATALLKNSIKKSRGENLPIVNTDWISNSIEQGRVLPFPQVVKNDHSFQLTTPSKKRKIEVACSSPSPWIDGSSASPTKNLIIGEFEKLLDRYVALGDQFRIKSYRTAINSLKRYEGEIKSIDDVKGLPGIGSKTEEKIKEILSFGSLEKNMYEPDGIKELLLFQQIYGVGVETAKKWYSLGLRTVDDLVSRSKELKLTQSQLKGIKYLSDFMIKIPRDEVEKIADLIANVLNKIDPLMKTMLLGSYRRGASTSSDIDILIYPSRKGYSPRVDLLENLIECAKKDEIIIDDLLKSETMFNGVCKLEKSGLARRIDFLLCARFEERGSFQLHFTGNELYNRKLRQLANEKGYHLSQHGLYQKVPGSPWVAGETEEEILQALGVEYLRPELRNF